MSLIAQFNCKRTTEKSLGWSCSLPSGHEGDVHIAFHGHDFSREAILIWEDPKPAPPSRVLFEVK